MRHGLADEDAIEPALIELAYACDLPLVATNDVHFFATEDCTRRTTRCSASPRAPRSRRSDRRRLTPSTASRRAGRDARRCSPTCRRRSTTRW